MKVLVLGSFDVLHYGHIRFLNEAAKLGEVVVGLGTDEYQKHYKRAPILTYDERAAALTAMGYTVVRRASVAISPLLDIVRPDYLAAGSDWINQPFLELSGIDQLDLEQRGIALVYIPRPHNMSTSEIINRVQSLP